MQTGNAIASLLNISANPARDKAKPASPSESASDFQQLVNNSQASYRRSDIAAERLSANRSDERAAAVRKNADIHTDKPTVTDRDNRHERDKESDLQPSSKTVQAQSHRVDAKNNKGRDQVDPRSQDDTDKPEETDNLISDAAASGAIAEAPAPASGSIIADTLMAEDSSTSDDEDKSDDLALPQTPLIEALLADSPQTIAVDDTSAETAGLVSVFSRNPLTQALYGLSQVQAPLSTAQRVGGGALGAVEDAGQSQGNLLAQELEKFLHLGAKHSPGDAGSKGPDTPDAANAGLSASENTAAHLGKLMGLTAMPEGAADGGKSSEIKLEAAAAAKLNAAPASPLSMVDSLGRSLDTLAPAARSFAVQAGLTQSFGHPQWSQAVGDRVLWLAAQNLSAADIRLDPPDLGSMHVKVSVHQDQVNVSFASPHPVVREALDQHANRLREMFADQGLNLVHVDVGDKHTGQRDQEQGSGSASSSPGTEDDVALEAVVATPISALRLVDHYA